MAKQQLWLAAVEGRNKGRVFSFGFEATASIVRLSHPNASSNGPSQPPMDPRAPDDDEIDHVDEGPGCRLGLLFIFVNVYAVPGRHIRYAATKAFFATKIAEGSSVQSHGVKMISLVEKLEDLKVGLENDTYIDVILQALPPSYDPFIVNYNMNGLEKSIHELINMQVQYKATTHKFEPAVLVGEASTSKAKGKGARRWKRKKGKGTAVTATASTGGAPVAPTRKGKKKIGGSQWSKANDVCMHCHGNGHWKRECP
ncbi:UNVERIFIED_CONTAM: hypothetical protein Sradi_3843800 [Sesamum radiatum]|uniref:CCHC-type domain-containing protein n=1 Tax=Sesamum radiatum TaxID=300843 RepID=A0AAW2Q1H8_SESRA